MGVATMLLTHNYTQNRKEMCSNFAVKNVVAFITALPPADDCC
jgi:hypothetical protein